MGAINRGEIFLKAALRTLIVGVGELPLVGLPLKMGMVFWKHWVTELKAAQDALPEAERPLQLQEVAAYEPSAARSLASIVIDEISTAGTVLNQEQQETILDIAAVLPGRVRERTRATLVNAQRYGTAAHVALPVSNRVSVMEREEFYRTLLPARRLRYRVGELIGNTEWQLVELLGCGGFGEVWLAQHENLGDQRAVKFCQDQTEKAVLQREMDNLKLLRHKLHQHPHIVSLYESQLKFAPYWLAFEYVPGGTLEAVIRSRAWSWPEAVAFSLPLWEAMAQVHSLGIVHRDLKPANILLDVQGQPKIGDFGIGKILAEREAEAHKTQRSQSFTTAGYGSIGYMSPEQERGEVAHPADDIFALGVILWQMLAGTVGKTPTSLDEILDLAIPVPARDLLIACRFYGRNKRPQHAGDLVQRLANMAPVAVVTAPVPAPIVQASPTQMQQQQQSKPQPLLTPESPTVLPPAADVVHVHYLIHPDGTVTDTRNGLMWKRYAEGQTWDGKTCVGKSKEMKWDEIMPNGKQKSWSAFAGHNDWRVPTIEELRTLVYCSGGLPKTWNSQNKVNFNCKGNYEKPTINTTVFPETEKSLWFWSVSAVDSGSTDAWALNFFNGKDMRDNRSNSNQVRLVRGGR